MECSCEASGAQSEIQREHVAYLKEKDKKKKDKAKKWHGLSQCLVLNAASMNGQVPADEIPASYQLIINSETAAMADKELHSQMEALGHREVGFVHGTAASLYNGSILWNARDKPSNLSFFTLYENNPQNDEQKSRYLHLNILNSNTDNKNLDEIKASQKQIVSVPKDQDVLQHGDHLVRIKKRTRRRNGTGTNTNRTRILDNKSTNRRGFQVPCQNPLRFQNPHPTLAKPLQAARRPLNNQQQHHRHGSGHRTVPQQQPDDQPPPRFQNQ
jgi:hypothetical protein